LVGFGGLPAGILYKITEFQTVVNWTFGAKITSTRQRDWGGDGSTWVH
jgi:hypothetical protein